MAAVLCQTISQLCSKLTAGIQTIFCKIPCEACGRTCTFFTRDIFCGDFGLYMSVTLALNVPPVFYTLISFLVQEVKIWDGGCHSMLISWLCIDALLCIANIAASVYIVNRITSNYSVESGTGHEYEKNDLEGGGDYEKSQADGGMQYTVSTTTHTNAYAVTNTTMHQTTTTTNISTMANDSTPSSRASISRVKEVLCYDKYVALYLLALIFFSFWQSAGISKLVRSHDMYGNLCSNVIRRHAVHSVTCGFFFLGLGGISLFFSLCCATSRTNFRYR